MFNFLKRKETTRCKGAMDTTVKFIELIGGDVKVVRQLSTEVIPRIGEYVHLNKRLYEVTQINHIIDVNTITIGIHLEFKQFV